MGGVVGNLLDTAKPAFEAAINPTHLLNGNFDQHLASSVTNLDPTGLLPSGLVNTAEDVAPIALSFIPGVGPALGAGYAAARNYGQTGKLGSSLLAGGENYAGGELAGALGNEFGVGDGNSLSDFLGTTSGAGSLGATSPFTGGASVDANGLQSGTGLTAGSSDAPLVNLAGGGQSSFASPGSDVASQFSQGLSGGSSGSSTLGSSLSSAPDSLGVAGGYAPTGTAALASTPAATGGGIGSLLGKYGLPLAGAATSLGSNIAAQGQLKKATDAANAQLTPYLQTGSAASGALGSYLGLPGSTPTSADDILAASPGYKFTLDQGNRALAAQQAASGSLNSGAAQKAAEAFGTGLASQTGQQYFSNLQNTAGQGLGAAGQYGTNTTAQGTAGANADIATGNTIAQLLSGVGRKVIGYGTNGQPLYSAS